MDALLAHHVEHVARILHGLHGTTIASVFTMTGNHHFAQLLQVFIHGDGQVSILSLFSILGEVFSHIYHHFAGLVGHV